MLPALPLAELHQGDVVLVANTTGNDQTRGTAVAVVAGIEPLMAAMAGRGGGGRPGGGGLPINLDLGGGLP